MSNQPIRFARRGGPSLGSPVALALVVVIAGGVLIGSVSLLAAATGFFNATPSGTPSGSQAPASAPVGPSGRSPDPTPAPSVPTGLPTASLPVAGTLDPPPKAGPFSMDLYRKNAFVSELKPIYCVPAAMQTMINIMSTGPTDRSRATQKSLYRRARSLSGASLVGDGAEPEGWAAGLDQMGFGPYVVDVEATRKAAIGKAATALRLTGRPVGLLAWRGAHSWVMSGFTATADPAWTTDFTVTGVFVEDVWYPRISSIWGSSLPPDSLDPFTDLHIDYLPWRRPTHPYPDKDGKFVLVLPVEA
jgi:hypothetical protein